MLDFRRKARQQPLVGGQQARNPRRRRARLGKFDVDVDEDIEVVLVTAKGPGLDHIEQSALAKNGHALGGHASRTFGSGGTGLDRWAYRLDLFLDGGVVRTRRKGSRSFYRGDIWRHGFASSSADLCRSCVQI